MRTGVTLADITRAADELLAGGERPTVDGVRKILGTGSPNTVNTLLKQYYQTLPARLHLPAPIATAAAELYEKVRATAVEELTAERASAQQQLTEDRDKLAQERRDFEAERSAMQQRVADLNGDLDRQVRTGAEAIEPQPFALAQANQSQRPVSNDSGA